MEHTLAIETQYNSQKVSTSSKASVSTKVSELRTSSDWRKDHKLTEKQVAWEPQAGIVSVTTHVPKLTDHKKLKAGVAVIQLLGNLGFNPVTLSSSGYPVFLIYNMLNLETKI